MPKTKKTIISVVTAAIIALVSWYVFTYVFSFYGNRIETIMIGQHRFQVEIVSSYDKLQKGLSGRSDLCRSCGMIFRFSIPGRYSFWMKDMRFPLDIIWISGGKIIHIEKNVSEKFPNILLRPPLNADNVLELNAGTADRIGIGIGDDIRT